MCVAGARWVREEILEKYPDSQLRVYAVWFNMVPSDSRSRWPERLLDDPRVVHFWDEERVVGRWLARHPDFGGGNAQVWWDTFLLFGAEAEWDETIDELRSWGYPIVEDREKLRRDFAALDDPGGR